MNRRKFIQAAAGSTALSISPPIVAAADDDVKIIGVAAHDKNAMEFLARSEQRGPETTHFGYFNHIAGLDDDELFWHGHPQTEAAARFTLLAKTILDARHELGNLIVTGARGELTIYFNHTLGGNFKDPASFAQGEKIAAFTLRFHNVLNVQAPNTGIANATVDLVQLRAKIFTLKGDELRLGRRGLAAKLVASGQGTRTQIDPLKAFFLLGGSIVIAE